MPSLDKVLRDHRVDVRLYDVIYNLIDDVKAVAGDLVPQFPEDRIIGSGKIIALSKAAERVLSLDAKSWKASLPLVNASAPSLPWGLFTKAT